MRRTWGVAVEWTAWYWGCAVAALVLAAGLYAASSDGGVRLTGVSVVAAVAFVGLAGWGFASLYTRPARKPKPALSNVMGVAVWFAIVTGLRAIYVRFFGTAEWLGEYERLLLVAPLAAVLLAFARRTGLGKWSTRIAIVIIALAFVRTQDPGTEPPTTRTQAHANAADLATAQRTGRPLLVQPDESSAVTTSPSGAAAASTSEDTGGASDDAHCQVGHVRQTRRTLLGLPARSLRVDVWVCWDAKGKPSSITAQGFVDPRESHLSVGSVVLLSTDPFMLGPMGDIPFGQSPIEPERHADADTSPALARVGPTGRRVSVVLAWELRDPLADPLQDDGYFYVDGVSSDGTSEFRRLGPTARPATMYDVVVLEFDRDYEPDGTVTRVTPRGTHALIDYGESGAVVHRGGATPSVTLRGSH